VHVGYIPLSLHILTYMYIHTHACADDDNALVERVEKAIKFNPEKKGQNLRPSMMSRPSPTKPSPRPTVVEKKAVKRVVKKVCV
jgi:hypothetical protein